MPNSPAVTSKRPREEGERLPFEFFLNFFLSRTRARQAVFVFILHLFTGMPQMVVAQRVRGEGFCSLGSRCDGGVHRGDEMKFTVDEIGGFVLMS